MTLDVIYSIMLGMIGVIVFMIFIITFLKLYHRHRNKIYLTQKQQILEALLQNQTQRLRLFRDWVLLKAYVEIQQTLEKDEAIDTLIYQEIKARGLWPRLVRQLHHPQSIKRKEAIFYLGHFPIVYTRFALIERLRKEKKADVKLYLVNALRRQMDQMTILELIESVVKSRRFYQSRVIEILKSQLHECVHYIYGLRSRSEIEIKELFIEIADSTFSEAFQEALLNELHVVEAHFNEPNPIYQSMPKTRLKRFYLRLLAVLSARYHYNLNQTQYLFHMDADVVGLACKQLSYSSHRDNLIAILSTEEREQTINAKVDALLRIIDIEPQHYLWIIDQTCQQRFERNLNVIARVLVERIDYLFLRLAAEQNDRFQRMITFLVQQGFAPDVIAYLNRTAQTNIRSKTLPLLEAIALENPEFYKQLTWYLKPELFPFTKLKKIDFPIPPKPKSKPEQHKTRWLVRILIISLLFFPVLFVMTTPFSFYQQPIRDWLVRYVLLVNIVFVAYYMLLNGFYLILAFIGYRAARKQIKLWSYKNHDMLYQKGMLSAISIIAPAYNEEKSIIDSVQSLLNLNYPDFEVIVVNDGSKDRTLQVLIEHFELERRNIHIEKSIHTRAIQGIYLNKEIPNLVVVDKYNGGKADALNVGVNVAKNGYVCGIDADSLLAPDSLLRLMSSMLDYDDITLAMGGNIYAVNGSTVSNGRVEQFALPKNTIAKFQAIEYLRAFTLGRIAFSELKTLLIVSGAFGLFEKQILTEIGGYMTSSTLNKDTVGEDMELVVRITRRAYETKLRFRINYVFHANCYTEVPESFSILKKQRNRWQRGLIDILSYHRQLILDPRYKQTGLVAMPYFFFFEMVGPLIEIQGYLALVVGIILGVSLLEIVLLLIIASILLGIVYSLLALYINESNQETLSFQDMLRLLWIAVIENFGWRQFISIYRGISYFSALKETHEWGQMNRVGFQAKPSQTKSS